MRPLAARRSGAKRQAEILTAGIGALARARAAGVFARPRRSGLALEEQPFDEALLSLSPLYRLSREVFLEAGGRFHRALVSSPRTLSSPILLEPVIEYSPVASELEWSATDPLQRRDPRHLLEVRTYVASLFHEQSHRILWGVLPPPSLTGAGKGRANLRRYLNFVESLVITLDMALGDELGPSIAACFYLGGAIYDPGTDTRLGLSAREYRNYLQAALHATYMNLEGYDPVQIPRAIRALFPNLGELAERAARRSGNLDRGFIERTNPAWQKKHEQAVRAALVKLPGTPLELPTDPMDTREQYLLGERVLGLFRV